MPVRLPELCFCHTIRAFFGEKMMRLSLVFACTVLAVVACKKPTPVPEAGGTATQAPAPMPAGGDAKVVKIVSSLPRTGSANAQTTTIVNGIKMALDEVAGKVGDFTIQYEDWDDASAKKGDWDPEVEAANADKASKDPDVLFYLGTYNSGAAKIAMPILNKASVVMISPANTYTGLTKPGMGEPNEPGVYRPSGKVNYFRVVPADDIQGKAAAQWIQKLGGKSAYVLDDRGLYGKGIADVFVANAPEFGINVLGHEGIDPKAQEYRSLMTKIKALNPDWVFYGGTTQTNAGQIAKDMVAVGLQAKMMAPDGCREDAFIQAAGAENVNGRAFVTFGGVPPDQMTGKGKEFVDAYRKKFGGEPEAYAVYGYVGMKTALDVLGKVGKKDREAVRAAMEQYAIQDGALGSWKFDANGDTTLTVMSGSIVEAGKFKFATLLGDTPTAPSGAMPNEASPSAVAPAATPTTP
jgi:branched-chain amino acid transport system substrate-binding protein